MKDEGRVTRSEVKKLVSTEERVKGLRTRICGKKRENFFVVFEASFFVVV